MDRRRPGHPQPSSRGRTGPAAGVGNRAGGELSSPLSGRPLIRGYDAAESVIRLDGFDILNPYHISRAFSAFPVEAVAEVALAPSPAGAEVGGTLAGVVDLRGRSRGRQGRVTGGAGLSVTSATAWLGTDEPVPSFVAARAAFLEAATELIGDGVPYEFQDVYVRTALPLGARSRWDLTLYGSHDDFAERAAGRGMEWSNVLAGSRWRLLDGPRGAVDARASVNRFALDGVDVEVNDSRVSITDRFTRFDGGLDGTIVARRGVVLRAGAGFALWNIAGDVDVLSGDAVAPVTSDERFGGVDAFAEAELGVGPVRVRGGVRLDASKAAVAVQPRARLTAALTDGLTASTSIGRATRLYQRVTDQQPEPAVTFFDVWLPVGGDAPVPRVDHATLELDGVTGPWTLHASLFATRGTGLAELRPVSDQTTGLPMFRFGDSRTAGLELRIAWGSVLPQRLSGSLMYVLSSSERRWEDARWRPWRLDRRHLARLQADWRISEHARAFGLAEAASGQPVTPVREVVRIRPPLPDVDPTLVPGRPAYLFAAEGSARSTGTFRVDLGVEVTFGGPGDSQIQLGLSAINVGFGPVAPEEPPPVNELLRQDGTFPPGGVPLVRRFTLPAIPSVTVRIEF